MNKDYFKNMYTDFFQVESLVQNNKEDKKKVGSQDKMTTLFTKINELSLDKESKDLLKKIIEYMRKYQEEIETNYIPFRVIIESNNESVTNIIKDILNDAGVYFNYININEELISFHDFKEENTIKDCGLLLYKDLNGLLLYDDIVVKKIIYKLTDYLNQNTKTITIITGNEDELKSFFLGKEDLLNNYFNFKIVVTNPDKQDIYNEILEKVNLDDSNKIKLLDYITNTYDLNINYEKYTNDLINYISFNKEVPKLKEEKSLDEVFASLNELVGLDKVKKVLHDLVDVISLKEKVGSKLNINDINLHMIFLGNPGTGKTTIARLIANILYDLKYIKENKLIEVSVKDLVGQYVGQTAPKTMAVIEKSLNGVLFIDEAYALAVKNDNTYNAEAIATLIQAMENYRDKLVVIFAGYTKEMQEFINSNSGIASRIGYTLYFDDYTQDELVDIFKGMVKKAGFVVEDDAIEYLREVIDKYKNMKNFGNARFIRNIYEKTIIKHASNVKDKKQSKILKTITKNDISIENLILE